MFKTYAKKIYMYICVCVYRERERVRETGVWEEGKKQVKKAGREGAWEKGGEI